MNKNLIQRALIPALVLCFFSQVVFSQVYSNKPSSIFCFKVGMTSSNLLNDSLHYKSGILFNGGFAYSLMLNKYLNIGVEALFTGKAFKQESPIVKYRCYFIDIPLYAQINVNEHIRVNAGAQYSIASNSRMVVIDPSNKNGVNTLPVANPKPSDYGFLLGAEIDLSKNFAIGARYTVSGSTFFAKNEPNFGVFELSFKYAAIKTYKVFFHKKEAAQ